MKIFDSLTTGFLRALKAWKGVLIITISLLIAALLIINPVKRALNLAFGSSIALNEFLQNSSFDILVDLSNNITGLRSIFASGILLLIPAGILFYTFFSGGLFSYLRKDQGRFSVARFFKESAQYFWPFLGITLLISLMGLFVSLFLTGIIYGISSVAESDSVTLQTILKAVSVLVMVVVMSVIFLIADYSRAHCVSDNKPPLFKSIGYGFKSTFGKFFPSFLMMVILIIVQVFFVWLITLLIMSWNPRSGIILFIMFVLSQVLVFVRMLLRSWRYGSVTSLMERS